MVLSQFVILEIQILAETLYFSQVKYHLIVFSPLYLLLSATLATDIVAIIMAAIMIYHIRSKYTAVGKEKKKGFSFSIVFNKLFLGRKEIVMFFYLYMITIFLEMLLVTDIIPTSSPVYPVSCIQVHNIHKLIVN